MQLNDSCRALLRGDESLQLRRDPRPEPSARVARSTSTSGVEAHDLPLWHALKACRKRLADEHKVPPYVVFHDSTLLDMVQKRPTTRDALLTVSGVGDAKLDRFGEAFLDVILEHEYPATES